MDHHDEELMNCVRTRIHKNEEVTRNKLHERCRIHYQTVTNHFDHIVNKDLGDGTKVVQGIAKYQALIKDPPGDEEVTIEVDPPQDRICDCSWVDHAFVAFTGALAMTTIGFLAWAFQRPKHVCSWVPVPGADSWVRVCE